MLSEFNLDHAVGLLIVKKKKKKLYIDHSRNKKI